MLAYTAGIAQADGSVVARGAYYKERATRVVQPMLDSMFEVGEASLVDAHFLVDAITSASTSSGALNAEPFTENRYEAGGGYTHAFEAWRLGASARYSTESDYKSFFGGGRAEVDLAEKNTVVGVGFGIGIDSISGGPASGLGTLELACEPGATTQLSCDLETYSVFGSVSQIISRDLVLGASVDAAFLRGYQSNPYRSAIVENMLEREQHPTSRNRYAVAVSARYYVVPSKTTLIGAYRFYRDNWLTKDALGAGAHTPEVRVVQEIGDSVDASLRYRFHTQNRAYFYEERYEMPQVFVSDDVKLADFQTHTLEGKLGVLGEAFGLEDAWAGMRIEGILSYVTQQNRFGNAIVAQLALTVPFEY